MLQADHTPVEEKKKTKTKGGKSGEVGGEGEDAALLHQDWSQDQQRALELALAQFPKVIYRVADPHHFNADPDPAIHFNADPDPAFHFNADPDPSFHFNAADPDPAFHFNADPDLAFHFSADSDPAFYFNVDSDLAFHFSADPGRAFHFSADPDPAFHFNADPGPAFHFNADLDPAFHFNADPDPAPLLSDGNLRPLVCRPSRAPFEPPGLHYERPWPSTALFRASKAFE